MHNEGGGVIAQLCTGLQVKVINPAPGAWFVPKSYQRSFLTDKTPFWYRRLPGLWLSSWVILVLNPLNRKYRSSVERQRGTTSIHLHTQLDPFAFWDFYYTYEIFNRNISNIYLIRFVSKYLMCYTLPVVCALVTYHETLVGSVILMSICDVFISVLLLWCLWTRVIKSMDVIFYCFIDIGEIQYAVLEFTI